MLDFTVCKFMHGVNKDGSIFIAFCFEFKGCFVNKDKGNNFKVLYPFPIDSFV